MASYRLSVRVAGWEFSHPMLSPCCAKILIPSLRNRTFSPRSTWCRPASFVRAWPPKKNGAKKIKAKHGGTRKVADLFTAVNFYTKESMFG